MHAKLDAVARAARHDFPNGDISEVLHDTEGSAATWERDDLLAYRRSYRRAEIPQG